MSVNIARVAALRSRSRELLTDVVSAGILWLLWRFFYPHGFFEWTIALFITVGWILSECFPLAGMESIELVREVRNG